MPTPMEIAKQTLFTLNTATSHKPHSKRNRIISAAVFASAFYDVGRDAWYAYQDSHEYRISIPASDPLFVAVRRWLADQMADNLRSVSVAVSKNEAVYAFNADLDQKITIDGHKVRVYFENSPVPAGSRAARANVLHSVQGGPSLTFATSSKAGSFALRALLTSLTKNLSTDNTRIYVATQYDWEQTNRKPSRPMSSVILPKGVKEGLIADVEGFLSAREQYSSLGLPWHRGYLFHGSPGSGKTSIIEALAAHLGFNIHYLPLSVINSDSDLTALMTGLPGRTILVIEDIDVASVASLDRDRNDANSSVSVSNDAPKLGNSGGVSLAGLLNALDGLLTPDGLITIMTTNRMEALDDALIRPGRVDMQVKFGYLTSPQFRELVKHFVGEAPVRVPALGNAQITPTQVVEVFKHNLPLAGTELDVRFINRELRTLVRTARH